MYTCRLEYCGIIEDFGSFSDCRSALEFISKDEKLIIINYLLNRLNFQLGRYSLIDKGYIHVFDLRQNRYCDSFDF